MVSIYETEDRTTPTKFSVMEDLLQQHRGDLVSFEDIYSLWGDPSRKSNLMSNYAKKIQQKLPEGTSIYMITSFGQLMLADTMHEGNWYTPPARKEKISPQAPPRVQEFLSDMLAIKIAFGHKARSLLKPRELSLLLELVEGKRVTGNRTTWRLREKMWVAGYERHEATILRKRAGRADEGYCYLSGSIFNEMR